MYIDSKYNNDENVIFEKNGKNIILIGILF